MTILRKLEVVIHESLRDPHLGIPPGPGGGLSQLARSWCIMGRGGTGGG